MTSGEETVPSGAPERERRHARLLLLALVAAWLALSVPIVFGERTLYERDIFNIHLHQKAFGTEQLASGRVPYFRPDSALGQAYRSNPNTLPLYPGNLLFLVLPFWTAFNLHFALHWLLALFGMLWLGRALGHTALGSLFAAITYALSGLVVSSLTFYNLLTVAAWWPWALGGVVIGGRRGIGIAGVTLALAIYGGEPLSAAYGLIIVVALALARHGWRNGTRLICAVGGLSAALALPQMVAAYRGLDFSTRAAFPGGGDGDPMHPLRLLELLVPLPFGVPASLGPDRFLLGRVAPFTPFFHSVHFGVAALPLAALAVRRRPLLAGLVAVGVVLALFSQPLSLLSSGLLRFPEKSFILVVLAVPLLAAATFDRLGELGSRAVRATAVGAGVLFALAPVVWAFGVPLTRYLATDLPAIQIEPIGAYRGRATALALVFSAALLAATALAMRRRSRLGLLLIQLVAVLRLLQIVELEDRAPYQTAAAWRPLLPTPAAIVQSTNLKLLGNPFPAYQAEPLSSRVVMRANHEDLGQATGGFYDLEHPVILDQDGSASPRMSMLTQGLLQLGPDVQLRLLRLFGADAVVLAFPEPLPGLTEMARALRYGWPTLLLAVPEPAPRAWWPDSVTAVGSQDEAFRHVIESEDALGHVALEGPAVAQSAGAVDVIEDTPDRLRLQTRSEGGLMVLRRSFNPLWTATVDGEPTEVLPVNVALMGVVVPAGERLVAFEVDKTPDHLATLVALLGLGLSVFLIASGTRRTA